MLRGRDPYGDYRSPLAFGAGEEGIMMRNKQPCCTPKSIYDERYMAVIELLRRRRIEAGLTQDCVARQLRVPRTWVGKVERRERRVDVVEAWRLCRIYGIPFARVAEVLAEEKSP